MKLNSLISAVLFIFLNSVCSSAQTSQNNKNGDIRETYQDLSSTRKFINGNFNDYVEWKDDSGALINAHDGGIIFVNGIYYWYGLALRPLGKDSSTNNGAASTTGINLYSSVNLYQWKYEGVILPTSGDATHPLFAPMRMERPKIIYNPKTKKFVMWFHYVGYPGNHKQGVGYADAGVAWSDKITGPFHFLGYQRPINDSGAVKDCTLFMDTDSTAYFIFDRKMPDGYRCLHVVKLSEDFLYPTNQWSKIDIAQRREAPVVIKKNGIYYLITSEVSGWKANAAKVYTSKNIFGPWKDMGNPSIGEESETTFHSQPTYSFDIVGLNKSIIMLERHNTENFMRCSYIWLPVYFEKNQQISFKYENEWQWNDN